MGMFSSVSNKKTSNTTPGSMFSTIQNAQSTDWEKLHNPKQFTAQELNTSRGALGRIYQMNNTNPAAAQNAYSTFKYLQNDPNSAYYAPYAKATNQAVYSLQQNYGVDTSMMNSDWFKNNRDWQNDLIYSGTTNAPSKPGKKSTAGQQYSYDMYQVAKHSEFTDQVDAQWEKMQKDLAYWAGRTDLNLSDDEIIEKVRKNMQTDYSALYQLDQSLNSPDGTLLQLNHGTDYSLDAMYGAIWAARNPNAQGTSDYHIAMSAMGAGKVYKEDASIAAKRDWRNPETYDRYAVGMTLDDTGAYFGVSSFDDKTLARIRQNIDMNDETSMSQYNRAFSAEKNTKEAEDQLAMLYERLQKRIDKGTYTEESLMNWLDKELASGKYGMLNKMDDSLQNGGKLIDTTRAVNYRKQTVQQYIRDSFVKQEETRDSYDLVEDYTGAPKSEEQVQTIEAQNQKANKMADWLENKLTEKERKRFGSLPGIQGEQMADALYRAKTGQISGPVDTNRLNDPKWFAEMATKNAEKAENNYIQTSLSSLNLRTEYEKKLKESEAVESEIRQIEAIYGENVLANRTIQDEYTVQIGGDSGIPITLTRGENGKYYFMQTKNINLEDNFAVAEYLRTNNMTMDDLKAEIKRNEQQLTDYVNSIQFAKDQLSAAEESLEFEDQDAGVRMEIPFVRDGNGMYTLSPDFDSRSKEVWDYLGKSGMTEDEMWVAINEYIKELNEQRTNLPDEETTKRLYDKRDSLNAYLSENMDAYNTATNDLKAADRRRIRMGEQTLKTTGISVDPAISDSVVSYVQPFANWTAPEPSYDSLITDLKGEYGTNSIPMGDYTEIEGWIGTLDNQIQKNQYILDNYGLPEEYKAGLEEYNAYLSQQKRLYSDYLVSRSENYDQMVEDGKKACAVVSSRGPIDTGYNDAPDNITNIAWNQMTDTERDLYYAIYSSQGEQAAFQYYQDIEDSLVCRTQENISESARESAESGILGRAFNELVSIGLAPVEVVTSMLYLATAAVTGDSDEWYQIPSYTAKKANEATIKELHNVYDGTVWGDIFPALTEMVNNRGRSMMVGATFGGLFPEGTSDIVHAFPIATIAMADAYQEAIDAGLEPLQAWTLAGVNFLAESVTEGIEFGHYSDLFENGVTLQSFSDYFMGKLAKFEWLSEATGETLNNIIERTANRYIAGDKSEHEKLIKQYMDAGLAENREQAEAMVMADYVKEDIHTAIISALSSFMDVGSFTVGKIMSTVNYAVELQQYRRLGDAQTTINDLKNRDIEIYKAQQRLERAMENREQKAAEAQEAEAAEQEMPEQPARNPANVSQETQVKQQSEYDTDILMLENARDTDATATTSSIAAVLRVDDSNGEQALAAAENLSSVVSGDAIGALQDLMLGGQASGMNINSMKLSIQYAALADGACRQVMNSEAFANAAPEQQAQMLAEAAVQDANDPQVKSAVQNEVRESRIAAEEQRLMANSEEFNKVETAEKKATDAETKARQAEKDLETQQNIEKAKADAAQRDAQEALENPTNDNVNRANASLQDQMHEAAVTQEREQSANNAKAAENDTREQAEMAKTEARDAIRAQAEANINQQDQIRAEQLAIRQQEMQQQAEEQARLQAEEDERSGKAQEDEENAKIDAYADKVGMDDETRQKLKDRQALKREGKIDLTKRLSDAESFLALGALSRKLGMRIEMSDDLGAAQGKYDPKTNTVHLNAKSAQSGQMRLGQALVEVALHEITHGMEKTKSYGKYRNVVLSTLFGEGDSFDQNAYDLAVKQKQDQYAKYGENLTAEQAEREIVADFAKNRLADKDVVQRFMDAGMGGRMRNALHNINQAIKNFYSRMTGEERHTAENLRRAERAFQKALTEAANHAVHPGAEQFSIAQFAQATNMRYDEKTRKLYDHLGREIDGVTNKVTRQMIEQTPIGKLCLNALSDNIVRDQNGNVRYETNDDGSFKMDENGQNIPMTQKNSALDLFTGLMNMIAMLKDENLVWEIGGSTLESTFSALKANSDTQYHDTIDFGTICAKTQAIVNVMSEVMMDRLKANEIARKEGRMQDISYGLTRDDVLKVYNETHKAGLSVPCPVCYVFSRWMGVPSLLGQMGRFQHDYIVTGIDENGNLIHYGDTDPVMDENGYAVFDVEATKKAANEYIRKMLKQYGDKDGVDQAKTDITKAINKLEDRHVKIASEIEKNKEIIKSENYTKRQKEAAQNKLNALEQEIQENAKKTTKLDEDLREVEAFNWITQSLCKQVKVNNKDTNVLDENGDYVIDEDFRITPDEILMDMRRTGEFSDRYAKNWAYRTSRGAGMGKSILPYSGASLGDILLGSKTRMANNQNPFFNTDDYSKAIKKVDDARERARRQNLIGGQRLQSTSDFRPEWGLDYVMAFLELQAANSNAQMYTKVAEAVDLFASVGADVNLSIMGSGDGYHEATAEEIERAKTDEELASRMGVIDGKTYVMDFSDVTGMRYNDDETGKQGAKSLSKKYNNVQMILVGMNDTHIRLAMQNGDIDFIIPWHSSGNSEDVLSQLVASVEETLNTGSDYTSVQTDKFVTRKERYTDPETGKKKTRSVDARTDDQKKLWSARLKILTGIAENAVNEAEPEKGGLTNDEYDAIKKNDYLMNLYQRFYKLEGDKCYHVALTASQAKQIFPYEYWQTDVTKPGGTKETADENGRRFIEYCQSMGVVPRFSGKQITKGSGKNRRIIGEQGNFAGAVFDKDGNITGYDPEKMQKGYWKVLIDRKMYGLDGNYRDQQTIDVSNINIGSVQDGKLSDDSMLPKETSAKYGIKSLERRAARASEQLIRKPFDLEDTTQKLYSDDFTEAEMDEMLRDADADYQAAVERGDMEAAQKDVDFVAQQAGAITNAKGNPLKLYHGTRSFGFTKFDLLRSKFGIGAIFTTSNESVANGYSDFGRTRPVSSKYIEDDGTDETLIRNAKNINNQEITRLSEERANQIRTEFIEKAKAIAEKENAAAEQSPDYVPPSGIDTIFWETVQALGDAVDEDVSLYDEDLEWRNEYRSRSNNWVVDRNKVDAMDQLKEYFNNNPEEMQRLKEEGRGYYDLLYSNLEHTDAVIELEYKYKRLLDLSDKFETQNNSIMTRDEIQDYILSNWNKGNYVFYGFLGDKPLEVDAENGFWTAIKAPMIGEEYYSTDYITKWAKNNGYTSVIIRNVLDPGTVNSYGDDFIFFNENQIKSADPVTYDDQGNVIPLSERFNAENPDIRYSFGDNGMSETDMDQALADAGLAPKYDLSQADIDAYNEKTSRPVEGRSTKWTQSEGPAQRQFGGENGMLQQSDEFDQAVIDYVSKHNAYFPDTNAGQIKRAINWIRSLGQRADEANQNAREGEVKQDAYSLALQKVTSKTFDYRSADGQARMIAVMALASAKNDVAAQVQLADAFNRQGTDLGRSLQSRKLFKLMTPAGRIATLQKMMADQQSILDAKGKNVDLKLSDWIIQAAAMATEEGDMALVQAAAAQELAEQIPASWKDRLNTLRMLSMLANPRTHIRNLIGNALFVPAVSIKNKLAAIMELGVSEGNKTKTLAPMVSSAIRQFARQDAAAMKDVLTGEAKYNEANQIKQNQAPLGKFVKALSDFNGNWLEKEDWFFLKGHYRRALGGWMQANGYTVEQVQNDQALLDKGRAYAIEEAQKATYRDFNKAAQILNEVSRKGGVTGFLVDAVLPFKKTPANILRRGIEYSPIGIVRSLTTDAYHMKQYLDFQNGKLKALPDKAMSPTQVIDHLCSGLSGTAVMALGYLLAGCGAVTCGLDDDEDKFEKAKGNQEYAVRFSLFGQDVTFTMDWAAPMSMPFFVGAAIRNMDGDEEDVDIEKVLNAFGAISEPVFNLSMLDGVNTLFKTSSYDQTNPITQILGKIATNYASSYVPSALGAVARTIDDTRRKSFVEQGKGTGIMGNIRYALENAQNKIPFYNKENIPARDIWGNPDQGSFGLAERILENFILPGYVSEYKEDPIINEMERLYNATGDKSMIPEIDPDKSYSYTKNGVKNKVVFTDKEWDKYKETRGKTAFNELTELMNNEEYQKADNATQVQMIKSVWDHANKVGLQSVIPDLEVKEASVASIAKDSRITTNKSEMIKALNAGDYDAYDTMVEALREDDVQDSAIKTKISDTYRNQYKDAYRNDDYIRMTEIEEILDNTGFDFDYYKWQADVDKEEDK